MTDARRAQLERRRGDLIHRTNRLRPAIEAARRQVSQLEQEEAEARLLSFAQHEVALLEDLLHRIVRALVVVDTELRETST